MARIREAIERIENATAGRVCLVSPEVGRTYLDIHIEHGGLTLAQMTDIKVLLVHPQKTVTLWEYEDGVELNEWNKRFGRKTEAGTLSFYFRKPEMENEAQSMATALGTGGLQAVRIEFKIASGTTPNITAWARKVANRSVAAGLLPYVANHNIGGQAVGVNHFDNIEKRDRISSIHILNSNVSNVLLKVDGSIAYDLSTARADFDDEVGGRVPYANSYGHCIDFTTAGVLDEALVMQDVVNNVPYQVQAMRLSTTLATGAETTTRVLVEYLSTWFSVAGVNVQLPAA